MKWPDDNLFHQYEIWTGVELPDEVRDRMYAVVHEWLRETGGFGTLAYWGRTRHLEDLSPKTLAGLAR